MGENTPATRHLVSGESWESGGKAEVLLKEFLQIQNLEFRTQMSGKTKE